MTDRDLCEDRALDVVARSAIAWTNDWMSMPLSVDALGEREKERAAFRSAESHGFENEESLEFEDEVAE